MKKLRKWEVGSGKLDGWEGRGMERDGKGRKGMKKNHFVFTNPPPLQPNHYSYSTKQANRENDRILPSFP